MQIQLSATKIWIADEPVDFRKAIDGLSALVTGHFNHRLEAGIYIFYNRGRDKLKLLARHRNGMLLVYKRLEHRRFTIQENATGLYEIDERQLSWLLAGLDWVEMSSHTDLAYDDFY